MTRHNTIKSFIGLLLSAGVAIFAMLCAMGVFGWFSMSHNVTGNGMGVQTKSFGVLEIRKIENGQDIGVEVATAEMEKLENGMGKGTKFIPSACGQFTFYVHNGSAEESQSYSFSYSISVRNNEFSANEGLYPGVDTTMDDFKKAEKYINSHIMFFTGKDENGVYSGWINPNEPTRCTSKTGGAEKVTVYWVWVEQYSSIFEENSGLIEEQTRKKIAEYYNRKENIEKLLADVDNRTSESYNVADTVIGMTYTHVCFEIEVTKE